MPGSRGLSWHMGCPGTCASSGGTAPVPGSSTRLTALALPSQAPSVSAHRRWGAKRGQGLTHRPHLLLSPSSFHPHPTPLTLRIRLSLCHQSPAPAEEQTDKLCLAFVLINRLVNFFPLCFSPSFVLPRHPVYTKCFCLCMCVPAQTFPVPSLQCLRCCPVMTGVTNSAYFFHSSLFWGSCMLRHAAEGMESVL